LYIRGPDRGAVFCTNVSNMQETSKFTYILTSHCLLHCHFTIFCHHCQVLTAW